MQVKSVIELDPDAYLAYDDTLLNKNHSHKIEWVRLQYSGNAHRLIKGIGVVKITGRSLLSRGQFFDVITELSGIDGVQSSLGDLSEVFGSP